jgi:hypothetical protein
MHKNQTRFWVWFLITFSKNAYILTKTKIFLEKVYK